MFSRFAISLVMEEIFGVHPLRVEDGAIVANPVKLCMFCSGRGLVRVLM